MVVRTENGVAGRMLILIIVMLLFSVSTLRAAPFETQAFREVWSRTDALVQQGAVTRTWIWGPAAGSATFEAYRDSPGGRRLVQYFDKSRMEINDPGAARGPWYVTNGLIVQEMVRGQMQVGDSAFAPLAAPAVPVAGDPGDNPLMPTYADFGRCDPTLQGGLRQVNRVGQPVTELWTVRECPNGVGMEKAEQYPETRVEFYDDVTGLNVPGVFWRYFNAAGDVLESGQRVRSAPLLNWLYVAGHPITGAYWTRPRIGGQERDVLVQLFERRVLTYTPSNPAGWQVEMGNVGRHYYSWRYGRELDLSGEDCSSLVSVMPDSAEGRSISAAVRSMELAYHVAERYSIQARYEADNPLLVNTRRNLQVCARVSEALEGQRPEVLNRLFRQLETGRNNHPDWNSVHGPTSRAPAFSGDYAAKIPSTRFDWSDPSAIGHGLVANPRPFRAVIIVLDEQTADAVLGTGNISDATYEMMQVSEHEAVEVTNALVVCQSFIETADFAGQYLSIMVGLHPKKPFLPPAGEQSQTRRRRSK